MDNTKELTHISLCTGYGGIDLGLRRAIKNVRTVCYVEIESFVIENLVAKIEKGFLDLAPVYTDLKTFDWECFSNKVDILSGGFPCQPFSAAGRRAGDEDPRHLFPYIIDGIKRLGRPPIVFFENVEGVISTKLKGDHWSDPEGTPVLLHVLRELERLGYKATAGIFSASEIGAPHQRKRVFILGYRADLSDEGRQIVDGMLRATQRRCTEDVGNTDYARDTSHRHCADTHGETSCEGGRRLAFSEFSRHGDTRTAYPAPRGSEQYAYEPPRVTLGSSDGRNQRSRLSYGSLTSEAIENGQASEPCRSNLDRYEPPRTTLGDTYSTRSLRGRDQDKIQDQKGRQGEARYAASPSASSRGVQREAESTLGGDAHGRTNWMDYAELYESCDNRTDELRMLGNGVVPATAERAFRTLWTELVNATCFTTRGDS